ncbi:MAG: hypothetical protein RR290_00555 [Clostridia bacterium]
MYIVIFAIIIICLFIFIILKGYFSNWKRTVDAVLCILIIIRDNNNNNNIDLLTYDIFCEVLDKKYNALFTDRKDIVKNEYLLNNENNVPLQLNYLILLCLLIENNTIIQKYTNNEIKSIDIFNLLKLIDKYLLIKVQ